MIRRLVAILTAALLSVLAGGEIAAGANPGVATSGVHIYTYDLPAYDAPSSHDSRERGSPAEGYADTTHDADGPWSPGVSARRDAKTSPATISYNLSATLEQGARPATTTSGHAVAIDGDLCALQRWHVAAKTGSSALDALSPAIRSNVDDAIERAAAGKVRFPGHDGKVYNNSDGLLPRGGNYTEWTAAQAGAKRGADRVIIEGDPANPNAIYYWDHVNPPVRVGP